MRFAQMLLNKGELDGTRLLGRKTVELMTMNHLPYELLPFGFDSTDPLRGLGFGLGFSVVTDVAQTGIMGSEGVFSWGGAASTDFWVDPKEKLIGLLMPQFIPNGHYPVAQDFKVLTYQAIVD
jgi:CubicO group peptidase (beta-lactamase class C family)